MSAADPQKPVHDSLNLDWQDNGDSDWSATTPSGWVLSYAGPRFGLFERQGYSRFTTEIRMTRRGQAPAGLLREGGFDQFAKWVGYAVEHQTGDAAFDARVYLASDNHALARVLADRPEARQLVLGLFEDGARSITVSATGWTMRMAASLHPDEDGGAGLSAVALQLCGLSNLWPDKAELPPSKPGWFNRRSLSLTWFGVVVAAILGLSLWGGEESWVRQLDTFAEHDWLGMGLLALVAVGPFALLGGRRATSHRVLALLVLAIAILTPLTAEHLLEIDVNRLAVRERTQVPAALNDLRLDSHGLHRDGYEATVIIADRATEWHLTQAEADLVPQGRLCMSGTVAKGLRGLRFIESLRLWKCRPGEMGQILPLPAPES